MKRITRLFLLAALMVSGCGDPTPPVSSTGTGYYDVNNFVESTKEISETKLVTYDGPSLLTSSKEVKVFVNDYELFVYETRVNHARMFTWNAPETTTKFVSFDFSGKVSVRVEVLTTTNEDGSNFALDKAVLRPQVYGIIPTIVEKTMTFDISYPQNYVLEYNDDFKTAIQIFANPLEEDPLTEDDVSGNDIYLGPGMYNAGSIPVESNSTIYIAGGAYVYGQIRAEGLENITIRGRGIISGSIYSRASQDEFTIPLEVRTTDNFKIEGITFIDPAGWAVALYKSNNIEFDNVKIITARANGDGISVQSCTNVTIKGGYVRTWDDSLVVKNADNTSTENITFDGVVVWTDLAQSMEVGFEAHGEYMRDITFKNITVVHNFHKAAISIHNADNANISNVKYSNITIEDGAMKGDVQDDGEDDLLIDFAVLFSTEWSVSDIRGTIKNITVENVNVYEIEESVVSSIIGESATSNVDQININNVVVAGKAIQNSDDLKLVTNQYVSSVNIGGDFDKTRGAIFTLPYKHSANMSEEVDHQKVLAISQNGLIVPEFARLGGDLPFIGNKMSPNITAKSSLGSGTTVNSPVDSIIASNFNQSGHSIDNLIDGNMSTTYIQGDWSNTDREFIGLTFDFAEDTVVGALRLKLKEDNEFAFTMNIETRTLGYKVGGAPGELNATYTRLTAFRDYSISPNTGNIVDLKFGGTPVRGVQLRIRRIDSLFSPKLVEIAEVEFYPPSKSLGKPIADATGHADVYTVSRLTDGDTGGTSYYESITLPAYVVIDLEKVENISVIVLHLPPVLHWNARNQEIKISTSDSNAAYSKTGTTFTTLIDKTSYEFDPRTGNMVVINLADSVSARYIRFDITSNDIIGGYGAQLSEINIY